MSNHAKPSQLVVARWRFGWLIASAMVVTLAILQPARGWAPTAAQSTSEARSVRFALDEANDSGLSARVKLIDLGDQTRVIVSIRGVDEGEFLPHIHFGSCDDYEGTPVFPLALFVAGERSRTTVDIRLDDLLGDAYLVDIHPVTASVDELFDPATAVACGHVIDPATALDGDDDLTAAQPPDAGAGPMPGQYWSTIFVAVLALLAVVFAYLGIDLRRRAAHSIAHRWLNRLTGRQL